MVFLRVYHRPVFLFRKETLVRLGMFWYVGLRPYSKAILNRIEIYEIEDRQYIQNIK